MDISFSHIFREKAPLDSMIQVMGRLNREAETDEARLTVFEYDNEFRPYSQLELFESEKILREARDSIHNIINQFQRRMKPTEDILTNWSIIFHSLTLIKYGSS
ncbi:MAG: hypothetical protein WBX01_01805 [Nitrososphaeraceae archaeon]